MKIYYSDMELPIPMGKSIFLAGPTPRDESIKSWRLDAVEILKKVFDFDGSVCVPERSTGWAGVDYVEQVAWEQEALSCVDSIVFWVPRDIDGGMPGFTTNVEFGMHFSELGTFYGRPLGSDKNRYLDHMYGMAHNQSPESTLHGVLFRAVKYADIMENDRQYAMKSHCCTKMVYAVENDIVHYRVGYGYSFKYSIIDGDVGYQIRNCPWCGVNLNHHKQDMIAGEFVEHHDYASFPERMKWKKDS